MTWKEEAEWIYKKYSLKWCGASCKKGSLCINEERLFAMLRVAYKAGKTAKAERR